MQTFAAARGNRYTIMYTCARDKNLKRTHKRVNSKRIVMWTCRRRRIRIITIVINAIRTATRASTRTVNASGAS